MSDHLHAARAIRDIVVDGNADQIESVVRSPALQRLLGLLARESHCECFQFELALIASHVAATTLGTRVLIQHGGVPALVLLARSVSHAVREQAVHALSQIARESVRARDLVLSYDGAMQSVLDAVVDMSWSDLRCGLEPLLSLCRASPPPRWQRVRAAVPMLVAWLETLTDSELLASVCESLANVAHDGTGPQNAALVVAAPRLVELLAHESVGVVVQALQCVSIIVGGPNSVSQIAIDAGVVPALVALLQHPEWRNDVVLNVLDVMSNVAGGDARHIAALIDSGAIAPMGSVAAMSDTAAEIVCALLASAASRCDPGQLKRLVHECDFVRVLLSVAHTNPLVAMSCLQRLMWHTNENSIFSWAAVQEQQTKQHSVAEAVVRCGGVEVLERLRQCTEGSTQAIVVECLEEAHKLQWRDSE